MPSEPILPIQMRLSARPGQVVHQDFVIQAPLPNGALTATFAGDHALMRLKEFIAYNVIREPVPSDDPDGPPTPPPGGGNRYEVHFEVAAKANAGEPLPVRFGQHVSGVVECVALLTSPPTFHTAALRIEGLSANPIEVPVLFVIGDVQVEFLMNPVVVYQYQWSDLDVRVTLPGAPDTDLTLEDTDADIEIPPQRVYVPRGGSATARLRVRAAPNTPTGWFPTRLTVKRNTGILEYVPFNALVQPPPRPPELARSLAVDRIHDQYLSTGGRKGPLGYPTSAVELISETRAKRHYRGGVVTAELGDGPLGVVTQAFTVIGTRIMFVGFKCVRESDSDQLSPTDEPYFVITVDTGNGSPVSKKFGPYQNVETGREVGENAFLIQGVPPNPMSIRVTAYENDYGDADETARKLQEQLVELARQGESLAAAANADAADGPGVGPSATGAAVGALAGPLGSLLAVGIVQLLGLGDDYIGQGAKVLFDRPEEAKTPTRIGQFQGNGYNAVINIDGGEEGQYELYFDVHVTNDPSPITV